MPFSNHLDTSACRRVNFCVLQAEHSGPCSPSFQSYERAMEHQKRIEAEEEKQLDCGCFETCLCDYSAEEQRADEDADSFYDSMREAES